MTTCGASTRFLQFATQSTATLHTSHSSLNTSSSSSNSNSCSSSPAGGGGMGCIELFKECPLSALKDPSLCPFENDDDNVEDIPSFRNDAGDEMTSTSDAGVKTDEREDRKDDNIEFHAEKALLCIISVPSFMIPHDLIQFLSPYLSEIKNISTLRHASNHDLYFVLLDVLSKKTAKKFIREYHGTTLCSLQPTVCLVYSVRQITFSESLPQRILSSPTFSAEGSTTSAIECLEKLQQQIEEVKDGDICVLCLAPFDAECPFSFTTCCRHTFHVRCIVHLENAQCPVCRTQLDDAALDSHSSCTICHWPATNRQPHASSVSELENDNDLWVCLVCGFIGCGDHHGVAEGGHIREHYQLHLHAYAMNTDTRRVWDFAGEGYVHRLILNQQEDEGKEKDLEDSAISIFPEEFVAKRSLKIVEMPSPAHRLNEDQGWGRSQVPPLSQQQEDFVVSRKLESAAEHYSSVLAWKLEQQRVHYENKLQQLRSIKTSLLESSTHQGKKSSSSSLSKRIISSLKNERQKLLRQTELATQRLRATIDDRNLLTTFSANLKQNESEWEERAEQARLELQKAEESYRTNVPLLERRVRELMLQMDGNDTSQSQA